MAAKRKPNKWEWVYHCYKQEGPALRLMAGTKGPIATVFLRSSGLQYVWFVWDRNGIGGENSCEPTIEGAQEQAIAAAKRWGQWEGGGMTMLVCKNCQRPNHPHYDRKYGGYCLDCDNAGVPERDAKIAKLEAEALANNSREQPAPTPNTNPAVWGLVLHDMAERDAQGAAKYGTRLQPHNGRDFLLDAYQEALDLAVYLRGCMHERDGK